MVDTSSQTEVAYLPPVSPPTNHGHTTAAWFTMVGIMVGAFVAAIAFVIPVVWLFWVGMGIVVVGLVGGLLLRNMGYGQVAVAAERDA
ncbi:hypothetical protein GCM10025865_28300 [Paraoerskovia sediminicola]|uniref:Uncharacterized protein n=1 Tax=Paraoerskovia sediminicola TaxID=1138587 RepID=A0ABM8G5T4_9CELL|nr:HGxxPAAW family protein [Paraoerskovia sediminicola]BDZ43531.1 hypothetical protein GCM10025865_28300 [Paraoerskovia sediminicola]